MILGGIFVLKKIAATIFAELIYFTCLFAIEKPLSDASFYPQICILSSDKRNCNSALKKYLLRGLLMNIFAEITRFWIFNLC